MCLIIQKPAGVTVPSDLIKTAWEDNPDGAGIMYRADDGLKVYKVMPKDWVDPAGHIEKVLSELNEVEVGIHFRWKTHGPVTRDNVHPFPIPGAGGYIMHNGIISDKILGPFYDQVKHSMSDTAFYTLTVLQGAPGADDVQFWELVGADVGTYNKLLVMDSQGRFLRVNEKQWSMYKGLYLSNLLSCDGGFRSSWYNGGEYPTYPGSSSSTTGGDAVVVYTTANGQPAKLTRRERKILNATLRANNWGPFAKITGGK